MAVALQAPAVPARTPPAPTPPGDTERLLARVQAAEVALRASEDRFRAVFDFAPVGMALVALDGRFLQFNAALRGLLRCSAHDLADLKHADLTLPEDRSTEAARLADLLAGDATAVQFEKRYRNTAGQVFWALASVSLLGREAPNPAASTAVSRNALSPNATATSGAADGPCFLYQIQDLSEQKAAQEQLQHRAYHDDLTGLPNRALLRELTASWIQSAQRHGNRFALVLTDLDHFKDANDRFGHAAGDEVLRVTAQRQREALRKSDVVGRLGGDEFAALLADVSGAQDVFGVVRKMALRVAVPVQHHHRAINVGLSAGVALFPVDGSDVDTLFRCADTALYRAKSLGRGRTCFFSDADEKQVHQHDADAAPLAAALVNDRLGLHCLSAVPLCPADENGGVPAPQAVAFTTPAATPAAAVLSWHSPHLGLARHDQINAIAQAHGLGDELGVWMVRHALLALQQADAGGRRQDVALYFTPRQLRSTALLGRLQAAVAASGVPASRLVVVFPTGQLPQLAPPTVAALGRWRSVGFGFAFSDLGAQEIPLGALMQWKPRWVELADSLVASARGSARTAGLVKSLCEIARCLDVKVGARGEGSAEHDRWLGSLGCNWRVVGPDGPGLLTESALSVPEA